MGELGKIGIEVAKSTVETYMVRHRKPPSPTWRAFLKNHVKDIVVTANPTAAWIAQQIVEAFLS